MNANPPLKVCIIGAGGRGTLFASLVQESFPLAEVWGLAEPDAARRQALASRLKLPPERQFDSWESLIRQPKAWDAVVICTMDQDHVRPALAFMQQGSHVLLEKPMATTLQDCRALAAAEARSSGVVAVCHSLRSHKGFSKVRELAQSGAIGRILSLDQIEQVAYWHFAHSYVRGNWAREKDSTFLLMSKSCHDLDYMSSLVGQPCLRVASFGSLSYFKPEFAPAGSTERCTGGCEVEHACPYSARKVYVDSGAFPDWLSSNVTRGMDKGERLNFIQTSPYGRCVWRSDNDVVDHQVVALEYLGGVTATFTVTAFTQGTGRRLRLHGSEGEIYFNEEDESITLRRFQEGSVETIPVAAEAGAHGGGDLRLTLDWLRAARGEKAGVAASVAESLKTHTIVFAAERSRREGRMLSLAEMEMPEISRLKDSAVGEALDAELRLLLSTCFTKPGDEVFKERRYFNQAPAMRILARDSSGALVAQLALHDKKISTESGELRIGGIAEVCVAPSGRGRGLARLLLDEAHAWMSEEGIPFSLLFGDPAIYRSSGYVPAPNSFLIQDLKEGKNRLVSQHSILVRSLAGEAWPAGQIDLRGPSF